MDPEWKKTLSERGMTGETLHPDPEIEPLKQKLLSIGGEAAVFYRPDPDDEKIMERGVLHLGDNARQLKGLHNQCHGNSVANFKEHGHRIMTGYALSEDGAWRQHTWNRDRQTGQVIETTELRTAYFGFELRDAEAEEFADYNHIAPDPIYARGNPDEPFINVLVIDDGDSFSLEHDEDEGAVEARIGGRLPSGPNVVRLWIVERDANRLGIAYTIDMCEVTVENGSTIVRSDAFSVFDPSDSVITHTGLIEKLSAATADGPVSIAIDETSEEYAHLSSLAWKNYHSE